MTAITRQKIESFVPLFLDWVQKAWMFLAAFVAVLVLWNTFFTIGINVSESLPQKVFLVLKQSKGVGRGDYVAFKWQGDKPYPRGLTFIKIVAGIPGDVVTEQNREFTVNGMPVGRAKEKGSVGEMAGVPLQLGPTGPIPDGKLYVRGTAVDSLDSRYALLGLVSRQDIVGKAIPLF